MPYHTVIFHHIITFYSYIATTVFTYSMADPSIPFIILLLGIASLITYKKKYLPLSLDATEQIRGLAIIAIILSHYITRVFIPGTTHYYWIFKDTGGLGVGVFLLISGYGLMSSFLKSASFKPGYLWKRILRILLPYWLFIAVWFVLDWQLLSIHHTIKQVLEGLAGLVILGDYTKDINPSMWFITFILVYSIAFYIIFSLCIKRHIQILFLYLVSAFAILLSKYIATKHNFVGLIQWGDYSLFFPTGVLVGQYAKSIQEFVSNKSVWLYILAFIIIFIFGQYYPVLLTLLLFIPVWYMATIGYISRFLYFLGSISYELYLVHIPFLLKYDFFLYRTPHVLWFFFYFILMVGIATLVNKYISNRLYLTLTSRKRI